MKSETIKKAGLELAEHLLSLSDEEFTAELEKAKTDDPELLALITDLIFGQAGQEVAPNLTYEMLDEYSKMPDTLDMAEMNRPPPFIFSLEEIDKIYQDAKKSDPEK